MARKHPPFVLQTGAALLLAVGLAVPGRGGVVGDGSVGPAGTIGKVGSDFPIPHTLGKKVSGNLFHSFSEFNLLQGESATFSGPADVQNILARVTGGTASSIDGTIRSTIGGANLYLLNSKGVIFGPNAKIDVDGAFTVSSADYLKLGTSGQYNGTPDASDVLTSAPVSAFGFVSPAPGAIKFNGSNLAASPNRVTGNTWVIGGDIDLQNASLSGANGRLGLISVASVGELALDAVAPNALPATSGFATLGSVHLSNSELGASGAQGGRLLIRSGSLVAENESTVSSLADNPATGDGVDIDVRDNLELKTSGIYAGQISIERDRATMRIVSGSLNMSGGSILYSGGFSNIGLSGDIAITTGQVRIQDESLVVTGTSGRRPGALSITADTFSLLSGAQIDTSSSSETIESAGTIVLNITGPALISNGVIEASAFKEGPSGKISITAGSLSLNGGETLIGSRSGRGFLNQDPGIDIAVTGSIDLTGGAVISTETFGSNNGGDVTISADQLRMHGTGTRMTTRTGASQTQTFSAQGGDLTLTLSGALTIEAGAYISTDTDASGDGGDISISANSISLSGSGSSSFTGISASTSDTGTWGGSISSGRTAGTIRLNILNGLRLSDGAAIANDVNMNALGDAGGIIIHAAEVTLLRGGEISSSTAGPGNGGNILIEAGNVAMDGLVSSVPFPSYLPDTGIHSETSSTGVAGGITLNLSGHLDILNASRISTFGEGPGAAGPIQISARSARIAGGNGGFVTGVFADTDGILTDNFDNTLDGRGGDIQFSVVDRLNIVGGGRISAISKTPGHGGNIDISAGDILISAAGGLGLSGISASTFSGPNAGDGGDLHLTVANNLTVQDGGQITVESFGSGDAGRMTISAGSLLVSGGGATITTAAHDTGLGGDLVLSVAGEMTIANGGQVDARTSGSGAGGRLSVAAGSITIDGANSLLSAASESLTAGGPSQGLSIETTGAVQVVNGGGIETKTLGPGAAGEIVIDAQRLVLSGTGSRITSSTENPLSGGTGGRIGLTLSQDLSITDGALLAASTAGAGPSGDVTIQAGSLLVTTGGKVSTESTNAAVGGNSGNITFALSGTASLDGARLVSTTAGPGDGGNITLQAAGGAFLRNASELNASTSGAGRSLGIVEDAPTIVVTDGSKISSQTTASAGAGAAGPIRLTHVTNMLQVAGGGQITANTIGSGRGGTIFVDGQNVLLSGARSAISADTLSTVTSGTGGNVFLSLTGILRVTGNGRLSAITSSVADGGDVSVTGRAIEVLDGGRISVASLGVGSTGDAGQLTLRTDNSIHIGNGGMVESSTAGSGAGGTIQIQARNLTVDWNGAITAQSRGSGDAGGIQIRTARAFTMDNAGSVSATSFGTGTGGSIRVDAGTVSIRNSAVQADTRGTGDGGNVTIASSGRLSLWNGGTVSATTFGTGRGGTVILRAGQLVVQGAGGGMSAQSMASNGGVGGDIKVFADSVLLSDSVSVSAETSGQGVGGSITITTRALTLNNNASIATSSSGTGAAGGVTLTLSGPLTVRKGSRIATSALLGDAGIIRIQSAAGVTLDASSISVQAIRGNAGEIRLELPGSLSLQASNLTAEAGMNGGNIYVRAGSLRLAQSTITANAVAGNGGMITLDLPAQGVFGDAQDFVIASGFVDQSSDSRISASSSFGIQGTLVIAAPFVDLAGSLEALAAVLVDSSNQLRDQCSRKLQQDFSSYLRLGRGGQSEQPEEYGGNF